MKETQHSCIEWHDLGLQLGLYEPRLVEIEKECVMRGLKECFRECMSAWLKGVDKVRDKNGPSWLSLVSALEAIGQYDIAARIEQKYC